MGVSGLILAPKLSVLWVLPGRIRVGLSMLIFLTLLMIRGRYRQCPLTCRSQPKAPVANGSSRPKEHIKKGLDQLLEVVDHQ